jgi:integrase
MYRRPHWSLAHSAKSRIADQPAGRGQKKGKRDRVVLCLLVGWCLRRTELVSVTFEHIQQRDGRWVLTDLVGKGERIRTVPMPAWAKTAVDDRAAAAGRDSFVG